MNKETIKVLKNLISEIFPKSKINKPFIELKLGDMEEWDSQGNLNLLLAVEEKFNVRFSMEQMSELKSISEILSVLESNIK